MTVLESELKQDDLFASRRAHWLTELERLAADRGEARARWRSEEGAGPAEGAGQDRGPRACRRALRSGAPWPRAGALGRLGDVRRVGRGAGRRRGGRRRPDPRPRGDGGRRRPDGEGRGEVPARHQESAAGPGDRAREPPADRLPGRLGRASSCRCRTRSSPTASTTAASSTTTRGSRPPASSRCRRSWARAWRAGPTCRS